MTRLGEAQRIRELMEELRALDWTGMTTDDLVDFCRTEKPAATDAQIITAVRIVSGEEQLKYEERVLDRVTTLNLPDDEDAELLSSVVHDLEAALDRCTFLRRELERELQGTLAAETLRLQADVEDAMTAALLLAADRARKIDAADT